MTEKKVRKTTIGGQALIEGLMIRGVDASSIAVRKQNGEIYLEVNPDKHKSKAWYKKAPFIRGSFNLIESVVLIGYPAIIKSAEIAGTEGEPSEFEKKLTAKFGTKIWNILSVISTVIGVGLAFLLFMYLPASATKLVGGVISHPIVMSLFEGLIKIVLFLLYLILISRLKDIRRTFQYHGAEHKTIAAYEAGEELNVENIKKQSRFHPRCGTSFLLISLILSVLVFSVVTWNSLIMRVLLKLIMMPVVIGIAYEIIKFAGRHDNALTRVISAPGIWFQNFTTFEPDDSQIEVAIAAITAVLPKEGQDDSW